MLMYSAFYAHETAEPTWWVSFGNAVLNGVSVYFMLGLIQELRAARRDRDERDRQTTPSTKV